MGKRYEKGSDDLEQRIARLRDKYYSDLRVVTIGTLFVFDDDDSALSVLRHQGRSAAALCRIVPARERAAGLPDVQIIVDRATYSRSTAKQRDAILDHELYHIQPVFDEQTGRPKFDAQDRPKLRIRRHDHEFGWFDEIANRHGDDSMEVRQAKALIEASGQLYFDFGEEKVAA